MYYLKVFLNTLFETFIIKVKKNNNDRKMQGGKGGHVN